jgi:two-component system capsular synthesis sensor histidine kinase RcsC
MFEKLGFQVLTASSGEEGLRLLASNPVDLLVTDYEMPDMNGEAVTLAAKELDPDIPVLLFSGSTLFSARTRRLADACCDKAAPRHQLLGAIHRLLQKKRALRLQPSPVARASDHGHRTVA